MELRLLAISFHYAVIPEGFEFDEDDTQSDDDLYTPFLEDYEWMTVEDVDICDTLSRVFFGHMPNDSFAEGDCYDQISGLEFKYETTTPDGERIEIPVTYIFWDAGRLCVMDDPNDDEEAGYEVGYDYRWPDRKDWPIKNLIKRHEEILHDYFNEKMNQPT